MGARIRYVGEYRRGATVIDATNAGVTLVVGEAGALTATELDRLREALAGASESWGARTRT
ncbi:MAG: hypothetical protein KGS10_04550 [Chloroflexi bacterium]|nr:hypothetical protein [Chloroflexota bacterium]